MILAIRERNDVALEHSETKIEELPGEGARANTRYLQNEMQDDALQALLKWLHRMSKVSAQLEDSC